MEGANDRIDEPRFVQRQGECPHKKRIGGGLMLPNQCREKGRLSTTSTKLNRQNKLRAADNGEGRLAVLRDGGRKRSRKGKGITIHRGNNERECVGGKVINIGILWVRCPIEGCGGGARRCTSLGCSMWQFSLDQSRLGEGELRSSDAIWTVLQYVGMT